MRTEDLLDVYGGDLYRIGISFTQNRSDAEDAIQETLYKYMTKAPSFDSEEHEKRWLIRVMVNECRMIQRKRFRFVPLTMEDIPTMAPEGMHVMDTLKTIPYRDREALLLHYSEGYQLKEIAEMLGISEAAVKMRLHRGRKAFIAAYGKEFEDE